MARRLEKLVSRAAAGKGSQSISPAFAVTAGSVRKKTAAIQCQFPRPDSFREGERHSAEPFPQFEVAATLKVNPRDIPSQGDSSPMAASAASGPQDLEAESCRAAAPFGLPADLS
jgi:hypothetical protein